jgi:hypothetical protein
VSPSKEECQAELDRICERSRLRKLGLLNAAAGDEQKENTSNSNTGSEVLANPKPLAAAKDETEKALEEDEEGSKLEKMDTMHPVENEKPQVKVKADEEKASGEPDICKGIKKDGEPCTVQALEDGYCFAHSPVLEEKRKEAREKGGFNSSKAARLEKLMSSRFAPVSALLENVLQELNSKKMDPRTALAIASVSKALVSVMSTGELEERLRILEEEKDNKHSDAQ